jgi:hypothetical protein
MAYRLQNSPKSNFATDPARLNARLAPKGYIIHASKGKDPKRLLVRTDEDERGERYGLFELRPTPTKSLEGMTGIECRKR